MIGGALSQYTLSGTSTAKVAVAARTLIEVEARADMIGKITLQPQFAEVSILARANARNSVELTGGTAIVDISARIGLLKLKVQMNASALIEVNARAVFNNPTYVQINKSFFYKVYDNGQYVNTIKPSEIASDFGMKQDINSTGSVVSVVLKRPADNFGEGFDIKLGNTMEIYVTDAQAPNGLRLFSGYMYDYEADYLTDELTIELHGFGDELSDYIIESGESLANGQPVQNNGIGIGNTQISSMVEHVSQAASMNYLLSRRRYRLRGNSYVVGGDVDQGGGQTVSYTGQTVTLKLFASETDLRSNINPLRTASVQIDSTEYHEYSFEFATPLGVVANQKLYARLTANNQNTTADLPHTTFIGVGEGDLNANEAMYRNVPNNGGWTTLNREAWYEDYSATGSTSAAYNTLDPAVILRRLIDDYRNRGGTLRYTSTSIDDTNSLVSYTFNTNTLLEGVNKILELCPEGWYWYVDQAENVIHLHKKKDTADHIFVIGRHLTQLSRKSSVEPIVNKIHFVGGGDPVFYKRYSLPQTESSYKRNRTQRLKDGRVTLEDTANIITSRSLRDTPGIYVKLGVGDNNITTSKGYDIESVKMGQMVRIGSSGNSRIARYDQATYDNDIFDYDPKNIGTQIFQIVTLTYTPNEIVALVSNISFDVNKRTQDIKRNLKDEQFSDTPAVPIT